VNRKVKEDQVIRKRIQTRALRVVVYGGIICGTTLDGDPGMNNNRIQKIGSWSSFAFRIQ
jgi:hypothetical protein